MIYDFTARKSFVFFFIIIFIFIVFVTSSTYAQEVTTTPSPTPADQPAANQGKIQELEKQISDLQKKIADSQSQQKTLNSQISIMDNQVRLTELRIKATKQDIAAITEDIETTKKKIGRLEESLERLTKILLNRIVATYQVGSVQPLQVLLSSVTAFDFFNRINYLRIVQENDKKLIYETQQARNDYSNQKNIFEDKKKKVESLQKQLEAYTLQLDENKKSKQSLLTITKNDEQRYQKLLKEAQAQISAFKSFASFQGGASILPPQPSPDGWYYNQRDERWGRTLIGSSPEQVWDVGCLLTSMAMVLKKHGQDVTPANVAGNSGYFFSNTAYMLLPWGGGRFSSAWGYNQSEVDNKLASGEPVITGVKAGVYGMHFVVLKSGSGGDYIMNDPWHGPNLKFQDHYSTAQIFQYGFYN